MKIFFALFIFFFAIHSFAQEGTSPQLQTNHSWFCMADGIDPAGGRSVEVSGDNKPTLQEAQNSAVQRCMQLGLMACQYSTCIDEGGFFEFMRPVPVINGK